MGVEVKGTTLAGRQRYVLRYYGPEALQRVLDNLHDKQAARKIAGGPVKALWYPFDLFVDFSQAIDRTLGAGDGALYRQMAAQTAEDDLSSVYKIFFRFMQPLFIINKAAQLWETYYSSGRLKVSSGPGLAEIEIVEFATPHWAHCESVLGWTHRSIVLTGVKDVAVEHLECRAKGEPRCRMRVTWAA